MPPCIDEGLLAKLVAKYGLDVVQKPSERTRLWLKLTRDYNQTTGSSFPKAKVAKRWQNIVYRKRAKGCSREVADEAATATAPTSPFARENVWTVADFVLRDLFLYLVRKHRLEETVHPRLKSKAWSDLSVEFHSLIDRCVVLRQEKLAKKWQNWKAYNKAKRLPHPFEALSDRLDIDVIGRKLIQLRDRLLSDKVFAARLAQEGDGGGGEELAFALKRSEPVEEEGEEEEGRSSWKNLVMKRLRCESERLRIVVENGRAERRKLEMEVQLVAVHMERAKAELAISMKRLEDLSRPAEEDRCCRCRPKAGQG